MFAVEDRKRSRTGHNKMRYSVLLFLLTVPAVSFSLGDLRITNRSVLDSLPIKYGMAYLLREDSSAIDSLILDVNGQGVFRKIPVTVTTPPSVPSSFLVSQNFPNPFNPSTRLEIDLERQSTITCQIYSVDGKRVKHFVFESLPGRAVLEWHGEDDVGKPLAAGVYFARISDGKTTRTVKMILLGSSGGQSRIYQLSTAPMGTAAKTSGLPAAQMGKLGGSRFMIHFANTDSTSPQIVPWTTKPFEVSSNLDTTFYSQPCFICPINFSALDTEPAWSPDGSTIAYVGTGPAIYLIEPNGLNKRLWYASAGVGSPSWSPDGQWIAFHDNAQIYKRKLNGDSLMQLTTQGRNFFPAWSPDGQWIAYDRSLPDESGPGGIWRMKADGSSKQPLFGGAYPAWHPSGTILLGVIGTSPTSIWTRFVRYDVAQGKPVDTLAAAVGNDNRHPRYSPDGTKIMFYSSSNRGGGVWLMNADGSNAREIIPGAGEPCWSPDGQKIVAVVHRRPETAWPQQVGTLWIYDLLTQQLQQLTFNNQ